jgi:tetratricopeptide (TPR) repeat protein
VQAYQQSKFEEAERHFVKAIEQDADNATAHMYLATVYLQQYIPGAETPDNESFAERAIEQYKAALNLDLSSTDKVNATKGIGYLYLQMKNLDDSRSFYLRATELDPNDPEAYYSIGVIDWMLTYQPRMDARAKLNLGPETPLSSKNKKVCAQLHDNNWANIADGIDNLNKAIQLRPDYDDAMAYMNLMYRERADVQCDDPAARATDLKRADEWVDKTMATKRLKAEKANAQTQRNQQ